jgi:hypothetical protein
MFGIEIIFTVPENVPTSIHIDTACRFKRIIKAVCVMIDELIQGVD